MDHITFTDSEGVIWGVREDGADDARTSASASDVAPGTLWLRFENESEVRRLWHYPDDWRGLSPVQLESLLDRATTVIARFRPVVHRDLNTEDAPGRLKEAAENRAVRQAPAPPPPRGGPGAE